MGRETLLRRASKLAQLVILAAAGSAVLAPGGVPFAGTPDIELGRYLATECLTCHRSATATSTIPNIFGMAEPRFVTLVKAYRDRQLPNPVMQTVAGRLSDEDIESLAAYFARTKKP
jgi:cytochrome c553